MQASQRKQHGFTLVEVIVVAVIVAALAAVSVPLYLNYVNSSRTNAASNTAGSVASFMGACRNTGGNIGAAPFTSTTLTGVVTCPVGGATVNIPAEITVTNTVPASASAAGTISAIHTLGGTAATFNY